MTGGVEARRFPSGCVASPHHLASSVGLEVLASGGNAVDPAAATADAVREAAGSDRMPAFGPLAVTVPGAVRGWFDLLDRFGTRSFEDLAESALRYAREGFVISDQAAKSLERARDRFAWSE